VSEGAKVSVGPQAVARRRRKGRVERTQREDWFINCLSCMYVVTWLVYF